MEEQKGKEEESGAGVVPKAAPLLGCDAKESADLELTPSASPPALPLPPNLTIVSENILRLKAQYIAQQCNCLTREAKGLALALFRAFPHANNYHVFPRFPGTISVHGDGKVQRYVINMFAQRAPGPDPKATERGKRPAWFIECLDKIGAIEDIQCVAFPWQIGCGMAGGDWNTYLGLIKAFAMRNPNLSVLLCRHESGFKRPAAADGE